MRMPEAAGHLHLELVPLHVGRKETFPKKGSITQEQGALSSESKKLNVLSAETLANPGREEQVRGEVESLNVCSILWGAMCLVTYNGSSAFGTQCCVTGECQSSRSPTSRDPLG